MAWGEIAGGPPVVERLAVHTVQVPDPGDLLAALPRSDVAAWVRRGAGVVGWGEAAQVTLPAGNDRFATAEKWLREVLDGASTRDEVRAHGTGLIAFGSFTFDDCSDGSVLTIPRVVLGRDGSGLAWLTTITTAGTDVPRDNAVPPGNAVPADNAVPPGDAGAIRWQDGTLSAAGYEDAVAAAVRRIIGGDLRKVVLARDVHATAERPFDSRAVLTRLSARYPDCYTFACGGLVGATPELLIRRDGDAARSLVLAGTTPRGATPEDDAALAARLLGSAKEVEEHLYAAASVRDVLAPLCESLDVSLPELLTLPNVHHLATRVVGRLATDRSALALAAALHPTAAVGGDPTDMAVELIRELESMDRGRYAGPVGWVDASGNGEWCIALRCAELDGNRARLFAGCGIVAGSDPATELAETMAKLRPMLMALDSQAE
jgi:menaquinone-specific isochorismate synthase